MNSTSTSVTLLKGDLVCRSVYWVDIIRFLFFNYVLHAATVLSSPGDGIVLGVIHRVVALFVPLFGTLRALAAIHRYARGESNPLEVALRARALCMVQRSAIAPTVDVPEGLQDPESALSPPSGPVIPVESPTRDSGQSPSEASDPSTRFISLAVTTVQGQTAVESESFKLWTRYLIGDREPCLVSVPHYYTVAPVITGGGDCDIGSNYSVVKIVAAIAQIVYGSVQLYQTSGKQIEKFGYAAYQLTIIPYIIMSLINLLAALCEPEFPAMLLVTSADDVGSEPRTTSGDDVRRESKSISGEIGIVTAAPWETIHASRMKKSPKLEVFLLVSCFVLAALALIGPYIIIYCLTRFKLGSDPGNNLLKPTRQANPDRPSKRSFQVMSPWVVLWISYGQVTTCTVVLEYPRIRKLMRGLLPGGVNEYFWNVKLKGIPVMRVTWVLVGAAFSCLGFMCIITVMKDDVICIVI